MIGEGGTVNFYQIFSALLIGQYKVGKLASLSPQPDKMFSFASVSPPANTPLLIFTDRFLLSLKQGRNQWGIRGLKPLPPLARSKLRKKIRSFNF